LFIGNLSFDTDQNTIVKAFKGCVSARLPKHEKSGKSRGFAFVEFSCPETAIKAHDAMSGQTLDGRQVTVDFAANKTGQTEVRRKNVKEGGWDNLLNKMFVKKPRYIRPPHRT